MLIVGLVKTSLIDYPGLVSAVIFTYGCNFRCHFCHNPDLVTGKISELKCYPEKEVIDFLKKRKAVLDGVVITGGEPLINENIESFIQEIKKLGLKVKLDTNGTNPKTLKELIDEKLIDFIAMDIKNSPEKYAKTTGVVQKMDYVTSIKASIGIIKNSGLEYEFRSTILPRLHTEKDFHEMGRMIKGAKKFAVQGFRPGITLDKGFENERSFTSEELKDIKGIFEGYVNEVEIRENL